jgi:hypothetical protein
LQKVHLKKFILTTCHKSQTNIKNTCAVQPPINELLVFFITFSGSPAAVETNHPTLSTETDRENILGPSKELQAATQHAPLSEVDTSCST